MAGSEALTSPSSPATYLSTMSCRSLAITSACAVEVTPSFFKMCRRCMAMVLKLRCNCLAMSRVVSPCQTSKRISCSRGVSCESFILDETAVQLYLNREVAASGQEAFGQSQKGIPGRASKRLGNDDISATFSLNFGVLLISSISGSVYPDFPVVAPNNQWLMKLDN